MPEDTYEPGKPEARKDSKVEPEQPSEGGESTAASRKIDKQQDWFVHHNN